MLPSRTKALKGIDYDISGYEELKAEQEEKARITKEKVQVEMWGMVAGRYTQVRLKYRGEYAVLCVSENAPTDPEKLVKAVEDFYTYFDLTKTALLRKTSSPKVSNPAPELESTAKISRYRQSENKAKIEHVKKEGNKPPVDKGLQQIGLEYNNAIYKERVMAIFAYAKKKSQDLSIPEDKRTVVSSREIYNNIFIPIYKNYTSDVTTKNKATSTLRYMNLEGWIKPAGTGEYRSLLYKIVNNPYENEMPAQAEPLDTDYLHKNKMQELAMYREQ